MSSVSVSAPGRICLFGEHQDYLGLPVIAAAIDRRINVTARPSSGATLVIDMPDIDEHVEIDPTSDQEYAHHRDYLRTSVNVLRRTGRSWGGGYEITITGDIPINAGLSSSSAFTVAWLRFLCETARPTIPFTDEDLARWGYQAEVAEFGDPGGMMDHYCAALRGVLFIDTRPPFAAERCDMPLSGIVLGHSLEPKATLETLARVRADVTEGIRLVRENLPSFELAETSLEEAESALEALPRGPARRLRANLVNRELTRRAREAFTAGNQAGIGELLTEHHQQLRDGLDLSTEKIERMLEASLAAGALGGKINGSGGGGCMFAYAPGREEPVAEAIRAAGGVPYVVSVESAARPEADKAVGGRK